MFYARQCTQLGILYLWVEQSFTLYMLNPHGGTPYCVVKIRIFWGAEHIYAMTCPQVVSTCMNSNL